MSAHFKDGEPETQRVMVGSLSWGVYYVAGSISFDSHNSPMNGVVSSLILQLENLGFSEVVSVI